MLNCWVAKMNNLACCHMLAHIESLLACSNVVKVFSALFFLSTLQNGPSRLLHDVLDAWPDSGNFPDFGGFMQHL